MAKSSIYLPFGPITQPILTGSTWNRFGRLFSTITGSYSVKTPSSLVILTAIPFGIENTGLEIIPMWWTGLKRKVSPVATTPTMGSNMEKKNSRHITCTGTRTNRITWIIVLYLLILPVKFSR